MMKRKFLVLIALAGLLLFYTNMSVPENLGSMSFDEIAAEHQRLIEDIQSQKFGAESNPLMIQVSRLIANHAIRKDPSITNCEQLESKIPSLQAGYYIFPTEHDDYLKKTFCTPHALMSVTTSAVLVH